MPRAAGLGDPIASETLIEAEARIRREVNNAPYFIRNSAITHKGR
jgi:hypothetical protein